MSDPVIESIQTDTSETAIYAVVAAVVVVVITILWLLLQRYFQSKAKNTFLILGLSDSGKTLIFSKLINSKSNFATCTSLKENVFDKYLATDGTNLRLVDYPGAERLRTSLFDHWLSQELSTVRGVVFVVDSGTFNRKLRDVAELLYDVFFQLKTKGQAKIPVLVACNKQDNSLAKTEKVIRDGIEREFGLINVSRQAALSSTTGDNQTRVLTETGTNFTWSDLGLRDVTFVPTAVADVGSSKFNIDIVHEWIDSH